MCPGRLRFSPRAGRRESACEFEAGEHAGGEPDLFAWGAVGGAPT